MSKPTKSSPSRAARKTTRKPARPVRKSKGRAAPDLDKPESRRTKGKTAKEPSAAAAPVLDASQRKRFRSLAHDLEPIVRVGHSGVTDAVVSATARALLDHELIKVRLYRPEDKQTMAEQLAERSRSALCGLTGHTVILYRPHPTHPRGFAR